jgi:preprotein translocase subunit SecE
MDKLKLVLAAAAVAAGVAGYYLIGNSPLVLKVVMVVAGLLVGAGIALTSTQGKQFAGFTRESVAEAKRVTWPTRKEALQTTGVVFVFVLVMALFLWVVDWGLLQVFKMLLPTGR